ncbi:MAG: type II secretion system protein GspN [Deltaproteobacteria bacterium]|nr:MAG: type II secretion system protein GspN [Deltaproteobacteria bacterium]
MMMKNLISKHKKWFGYAIFALVLTLALLYYRFPSDALRHYLEATAQKANPLLSLSIDHIKLQLPVGLRFERSKLVLRDEPEKAIFSSNSLLVKPLLASLFQGELGCSFNCRAYNGNLKGRIYLNRDRKGNSIETELQLSNIQLDDYDYLSDLIERDIGGSLNGTISYKGPCDLLMNGSGKANLTLSDGRVEIVLPLFTLNSIDFDKMEIEMLLQKKKVNVTRLELKGKKLRGTLSGTIGLKKEIRKSTLDLQGTIEPFPAFFKSIAGIHDTIRFFKKRLKQGTFSFVIHGTMAEPRIQFT